MRGSAKLLDRFGGAQGGLLLIDVLRVSKLVNGDRALAERIAAHAELRALQIDELLIEQGAPDNAVYFIISGVLEVLVNKRHVAWRSTGDCVGEMAAIEPSQERSATVRCHSPAVVVQISAKQLANLAMEFPLIYRDIARELSKRLLQRNTLIGEYHDSIHVFIMCSVEALEIARQIQSQLQFDFTTTIWSDGVFRVTNYTLESLETEVERSDFAVAIAHGDDVVASRGKDWPAPRDNVIFELGLFMGRLGRSRAILFEQREDKVKLPSDLAGITTIAYKFEEGRDATAMLGPACTSLRNHIKNLGPKN